MELTPSLLRSGIRHDFTKSAIDSIPLVEDDCKVTTTYANVAYEYALVPSVKAHKEISSFPCFQPRSTSSGIQCAFGNCKVKHIKWKYIQVNERDRLYYGADGVHDLSDVTLQLMENEENFTTLQQKPSTPINLTETDLRFNPRSSLIRTRMCRYVANMRPCTFKTCLFAHSESELVDINPLHEQRPRKFRICDSVFNHVSCDFGSCCSFAHNQFELNLTKCIGGKRCIRVVKGTDGEYTTYGTEYCGFSHPGESKLNFFNRQLKG